VKTIPVSCSSRTGSSFLIAGKRRDIERPGSCPGEKTVFISSYLHNGRIHGHGGILGHLRLRDHPLHDLHGVGPRGQQDPKEDHCPVQPVWKNTVPDGRPRGRPVVYLRSESLYLIPGDPVQGFPAPFLSFRS